MANKGIWRTLVEEGQRATVEELFARVVEASLTTHPVRNLTRNVVRERFDICCEIFVVLRGDLKWSLARIADMLPEYFGAQMDGVDWKPSARASWVRGDDAVGMAADGAPLEAGSGGELDGLDESPGRGTPRIVMPGDPNFSIPSGIH